MYTILPAQSSSYQFVLQHSEGLALSQPDSAYSILKQAINDAREKNDPVTEAVCLQQIGQVFFNYGNYYQAVDHLLQADKIFRKLKEKRLLAMNLNLLGKVYYSNKQPALAGELFREALTYNQQSHDLPGEALTYGNIGHLYEKKLMYDSAWYFQRKALTIFHQLDDSSGVAKIYENLGSIFEDRSRFDSAEHYFMLALHINAKSGNRIAQIEILNNLGDTRRKTGRYADGLVYTRQAMALATQTQTTYQLASAYRDMARGFELLRNFDSAYYYNERSRALVEEIYGASSAQQIALLETVYEVDIKDNQIARLALDKRVNRFITIGIIAGILFIGILAMVIISRQRLKIRNEAAVNKANKHAFETQRELMQAELKNKLLEEEQLRSTLETRGKELSAHTLHLIQKNQLLEELRTNLVQILADEKRDQRKQLKQLTQKINISFSQDQHWDEFRAIFDQVHQQFFTNLKQHTESLTSGELRMVALLRMNISSADMAVLLGISQDSLRVARYRLKKKFKLGEGESLTAFLQQL